MASQKSSGREFYKYSGLGFEFVVIMGIFAYLGSMADARWQIEPWGLLAGCGVGLTTGIYFLVKEANKMFSSLDLKRRGESTADRTESSPSERGSNANEPSDGDEQ
ncbi:MAG: AtpZ/AtpI family protein [Planctomycetes bacterium]|nr:AtpZ/AtpI family protein [Planctomycetota bacterium]